MSAQDCGVFILAAGRSQRFGPRDKLMADLRGKPLLQHVIDAARVLPFAAQYGVIPQSSAARRGLFKASRFALIENPDPARGQGSSLALAARKAREDGLKSMLVLLGDMPFVSPADMAGVLALLQYQEKVISVCNNTKLPPMAVRCNIFDALAAIAPEQGAKALFTGGGCAHYALSSDAARDIDRQDALNGL